MTEPVLQIALDFLEASRALACAREAVRGGAQVIEAGTPLIKSAGLDIVRALRREFPRHPIVADLKIMDAGRTEIEAAAKAGATAATVLGVAAEATILECVEAGRNCGIEVVVDLVQAPDPEGLAARCEAWGVAQVDVHTPIDEQMRGRDPFDVLRRVRKATRLPVGVAGGLNSETAPLAVLAGGDIIIVGGAITKSPDAEEAARTIFRAMADRRPAATELFKRGGEERLREIFGKVSTPNISDAMHRSGDLPGLLPVVPGARLAGPAVTVRTYPGDWAKPVEAIEAARAGDVIVIDAGGVGPAVWGELASESCLQRKIAGVVIDGAIRDVADIRRIGFPAFARLVTPTAGEPRGFGETQITVKIGGVPVSPGDWIVGDDSGVMRVPRGRAVEVANHAMDVLEKENRLRGEIRRSATLSSVAELAKWEKQIAEGGGSR